jgi:Zn-dependent protease with chaperone function
LRIALGVTAVSIVLILLLVANSPSPGAGFRTTTSAGRTRIVPSLVAPEDLQYDMDKKLLATLDSALQVPTAAIATFLKPIVADVTTRRLRLDGVEVTVDQFPDHPELHAMVVDCAEILHVKKAFHVFVKNDSSIDAYTTNVSEPVIVLCSGLVSACSPDEIRFVIGHEMGHIVCNHVLWLSVVRELVESLKTDGFVKQAIVSGALLAVAEWSKQAEISADRAGLLCVQDLEVCEQALVRLASGLTERVLGRINVDAFLRQSEMETGSIASAMVYLEELRQPHPFVRDRIRNLRDFYESEPYAKILR